MLTVRTSENTVITSFRLISERQDFSSVRTGENTVRARARIHNGEFQSYLTVKSRFRSKLEQWRTVRNAFARIEESCYLKID